MKSVSLPLIVSNHLITYALLDVPSPLIHCVNCTEVAEVKTALPLPYSKPVDAEVGL